MQAFSLVEIGRSTNQMRPHHGGLLVQSQKTVTAYFSSQQLLPDGLADHNSRVPVRFSPPPRPVIYLRDPEG